MIAAILLIAATQAVHKPAGAPARPLEAVIKDAAAARDAGNPAEGVRLYREAVRRKPSFSEGWWWLGTLYYSQERWTDCRQSFTRFTTLMPKAGPGYALLGICDFKAKDYRSALQHLDRGEALGLPANDPNTAEARYYLAAALTKAENFERALVVLARVAILSDPSPETVTLTGIAALRKPIVPEELDEADREVTIRLGRAILTAAQRKAAEARQMFADVVADFPNTPNIHYVYGAYLLSTEPDRGLAELKLELERQPNHVPALVSIAMEYLGRGNSAEAKTYAERAVKAAPGNFAARTALGRALTDAGDIPGAVRELQLAVKLAPDSPQAQLALASAYAKAGRKDDAARARAEFTRLKALTDAASR